MQREEVEVFFYVFSNTNIQHKGLNTVGLKDLQVEKNVQTDLPTDLLEKTMKTSLLISNWSFGMFLTIEHKSEKKSTTYKSKALLCTFFLAE